MKNIAVTIRPLEAGDADAVQRYASDERVAFTSNIPHPYPDNGGEAFVKSSLEARQARKQFPFAILANGELIGVVGLNDPDFEKHTVECDYAIASTHWGQGIGTKAVGLAVSHAFHDLSIQIVFSTCLSRNPASGRVLEKNGFTETGTFLYNGPKLKDEPVRRFRLTKDEWTRRDTELDR